MSMTDWQWVSPEHFSRKCLPREKLWNGTSSKCWLMTHVVVTTRLCRWYELLIVGFVFFLFLPLSFLPMDNENDYCYSMMLGTFFLHEPYATDDYLVQYMCGTRSSGNGCVCVCVWTISKDVKPVPWVFWNFLQSGFNFNTSLQQGARNPWFVCPGQRRPDDMGVKTYLLFELLSKLSHCFVFSIHHLSTWWVFNSFPNLENHRERWQLNIYIYIQYWGPTVTMFPYYIYIRCWRLIWSTTSTIWSLVYSPLLLLSVTKFFHWFARTKSCQSHGSY